MLGASVLSPYRPGAQRENVYTVPNAITVARLAATPYIGYLILTGDTTPAFYWSLAAGASDVVRRACWARNKAIFSLLFTNDSLKLSCIDLLLAMYRG